MTRNILIHEDANLDLHEHFQYLALNNIGSAFHFFDAARETYSCNQRSNSAPERFVGSVSFIMRTTALFNCLIQIIEMIY